MTDVSPDLLEKVTTAYQGWLEADPKISATYKRIRDGTATFKEASQFAERSGQFLARAFGLITPDMLPDGKMYYNIAQDVVIPACEMNYDVVSKMAQDVMRITNAKNDVPLGAKIAKMGRENIDSIIDKLVSYETFEEGKWLLGEPIVNNSITIVDDTIRENVEFQHSAGIDAVIERVAMPECCDWCQDIAGVYDYSEVKERGNDVYRRHNYCRCMVLYRTANRITNAHSKVDYADSKEAMQAWQRSVADQQKLTPRERMAAASARRQRK